MPIARFFNRLFTSRLSWLPKIIGAGVVGVVIAARVVWIDVPNIPLPGKILALVITATLTMAGAGLLIRADVVRKRVEDGQTVGFISRLLFASGIWSGLIWIVLAMLIGFPLAIWIGSLTSNMPRGR